MRALGLVLSLSLSGVGCCPSAAPVGPMPARVDVDAGLPDHLDPVQFIQDAKRAIAEGQFEKASRYLLWAFDHGPTARPIASPAIATSVPDLLASLGTRYPPALEALRERKNRIEGALRTGQPVPVDAVFLYEGAARALGQVGDALQTCKMLPKHDGVGRRRETLCSNLLDELLDAGMWEEAVEHAEGLFVSIGSSRVIEQRHPGAPSFTPRLARQGARLFGAMLRLNRKEQAFDFAQRALDRLPEAITYHEMIDAARGAGHEELAQSLARRASSRLGKDELQRVKQPRP